MRSHRVTESSDGPSGGFQVVVTLEALNFGKFMGEKWDDSSSHQGKASCTEKYAVQMIKDALM